MSSSPAPNAFPIYLFVYLLIYFFFGPRHRRPHRRCHMLRLEKTIRLRRDCLLRNRYIGCEAPSFLLGVLHCHSQLPRTEISKLTRNWRHQLEIVISPFFVTMVYTYVKLSGALRGTQDYVSTLRIVNT